MNQDLPKPLPPRSGRYADVPGHYSLVTKLFTPIINRGDEVSFQLFFSGYGDIHVGKVVLTPPAEIFDDETSLIYSDLKLEESHESNEDYKWWWGNNRLDGFMGNVLSIHLVGGLYVNGWKQPTQFFDRIASEEERKSGVYSLSTEFASEDPITKSKKPGRAPLSFELKTLKSVKSGNYSIDIVFTYFNGNEWRADSKRVEFKVQNFLERFGTFIGWVAAIGSVLAIIIGFWELTERVCRLFIDR